MALTEQPWRTECFPQRSPLIRVGRVVSLVMGIGVRMGTMPGIWGATFGHIRPQVSRQGVESDIQQNLQSGRIPWWAPILMLMARPVFALVTQLAVLAGFRLAHRPKPLREVGRCWMVSGTLIDLLSLGTLSPSPRQRAMQLLYSGSCRE